MRLEIQIERLRKIDFLNLFTIEEVYGTGTIKGNKKSFRLITFYDYLSNYIIKIEDNHLTDSVAYCFIIKFFKKIYKNLNNIKFLEKIDFVINYNNNKVKIDNYLLKLKLEEKLPQKEFKIKGKKI